VLADESKARLVLAEFERDNPPGKFRKRKIEWAQFKKQHGCRIATIQDENQELMDIDDFCIYMEEKSASLAHGQKRNSKGC
jgi:hypothetical protein